MFRSMTKPLSLAAFALAASAIAGCGGSTGSVLPAAAPIAAHSVRPMDTAGGTPFAASCAVSVASTVRPMDTAGGTPFGSATRPCAAPTVHPADTAGGTPFGATVQPMDTAGGTPFGH